jgi:hypothetical protein
MNGSDNMRTDQFAGLPKSADKFLRENKRPPHTCGTCGHVIKSYHEKYDTFEGMFHTQYPLIRYPLKDGSFAEEFLQAAPWSSGPIHFLGLRHADGTEFTWSDEEIEEWL